jgi:hypothetical protein
MKIAGKDIHVQGRMIRIARLAAERYEFLSDPAAAIDGLRDCGSRIDLFTFLRKLPRTSPEYPYPMEWDNVAAVPVSTYEHWWTRQVNGKTRNMVRRAENKGIVVREVPFDDSLVEGITAIYDECPVRQGRAFWHYRKGTGRVRQENGTFLDRSVFLGAFFEERLVGFAKLVEDEDRAQAALMQILSMVAHRDKAPTNALIAHAVRVCAERSVPHLVYANFAYGNKQRDSLSDFKQHNGFQKIDVPRYYVPLTLAGRAALGLGLHRGLAHQIPEPVLVHLRKMRTVWHSGRLLGAREAS